MRQLILKLCYGCCLLLEYPYLTVKVIGKPLDKGYSHLVFDNTMNVQVFEALETSIPLVKTHSFSRAFYFYWLAFILFIYSLQIPVKRPGNFVKLSTEIARAVKIAYFRIKGKHVEGQLGLASMQQNQVNSTFLI